MSTKKIVSLCNMQLSDMAQWKITYANAEGSGSRKLTYSIRSNTQYVCDPNYSSVEKITKKINKFMKETPEDLEAEEDNKDDSKATEDPQPTLAP